MGVLAGSIVETHLTNLIRHSLHDPEGTVWKQRAHPSGPFGPFAVKIDLAFLVGLITEQARRDLVVLKDIRNRFAHDLAITGFDDDSISAKCRNLTLIDEHVGDWPPGVAEKIMEASKQGDAAAIAALVEDRSRIIVSGAAEDLKTPRGRYIWAARLFSLKLGLRALPRQPARLGDPAI